MTIDNFAESEYNFFRPHLETKFLIHGFRAEGSSEALLKMKEAYLDVDDMNVIGACFSKITTNKSHLTFRSE